MTGAALALATVLGFTAPYTAAEEKIVNERLEECEVIEVHATAYTWTGNQTSSGTWPEEGRTLACNFLDEGSVVFIDGFGTYTVEDCGYLPYPNNVDIYMDSYDACIQHGVQILDMTVLREGWGDDE